MKIDYFSHNTRRSLQSTEQPEYGAHELLERIGIDLKNYQNGIAKVLAEHAKLISAAKVLDFGGGNGDLAVRFFNYSDIKPYVLEIDPKLRESMRIVLLGRHNEVQKRRKVARRRKQAVQNLFRFGRFRSTAHFFSRTGNARGRR